jgi:hypothetical protein
MPGSIEEWISTIGAIVGALWVVVTIVTGMTKTPDDDIMVGKIRVWLARIFGWSTFSNAGKSLKLPFQDPKPPVQ